MYLILLPFKWIKLFTIIYSCTKKRKKYTKAIVIVLPGRVLFFERVRGLE